MLTTRSIANCLALGLALSFLAACGGEDGSNDEESEVVDGDDADVDLTDTEDPANTVARVEIEPAGALLESASAEVELTAIAYNGLGEALDVAVIWELTPGDAVIELGAGRFAATETIGSAQVRAVADGVSSVPVPLLNARVAPGVVRYDDSAFVELDVLDTPGANGAVMVATFAAETAFGVGDVIVGSGGDGVVGRVVATSTSDAGVEVALAQVTLSDLFREFATSGEVDLGPLASAEEGAADEKRLGVECSTRSDTVDLEIGSLNLTNLSRFTAYPSVSWTLDDAVREVRLQGRLGIDLGASIELGFTPGLSWSCNIEMYALPLPILPLPWSLGFVVEAPMGLRVDIEASAEAADVTASLTASTGFDINVGVRCEDGAECIVYDDVSLVPAEWTPDIDWSVPLQVEATVFAGAYATIWAGVPLSTVPRSERPGVSLANARGGMRMRLVKAGVPEQLSDAELAGRVSLETGWSVSGGVSGALLEDLFGASLELFNVESWEDWLRTPIGALELRNTDPVCGAPDEPTLQEGCTLDVSVLWEEAEGVTELTSVLGWRLYQQEGEEWVEVGEAGAAEALRWTPDADDLLAGRVTFGAVYAHAWLPGGSGRLEVRNDSRVTLGGNTCSGDLAAPGEGFVRIAAGTFTMGSPSSELGRNTDETQHEVTLTRDFWLQTTEVTQGDYQALMGSNPSSFTSVGSSWPVESVTWFDAIDYANARSRVEGLPECYDGEGNVIGGTTVYECCGYRLPTEAEWEYAARAGTSTGTYRGDLRGNPSSCDSEPNLDPIAWFCGNSDNRTRAVGTRAANAWGLYDMLGNVFEWTSDWYGEYPATETDPVGSSFGSFRVLRGGGWSGSAFDARAAYRGADGPFDLRDDFGFRLARSLP